MTRNPGQHGKDTADVITTRPPENELPVVVGHAEMDAALEHGLAVTVSQSIGWLMRYQSAWWVIYEEGWYCVPQGPIADSIDQLYPRIVAAETAARQESQR